MNENKKKAKISKIIEYNLIECALWHILLYNC